MGDKYIQIEIKQRGSATALVLQNEFLPDVAAAYVKEALSGKIARDNRTGDLVPGEDVDIKIISVDRTK